MMVSRNSEEAVVGASVEGSGDKGGLASVVLSSRGVVNEVVVGSVVEVRLFPLVIQMKRCLKFFAGGFRGGRGGGGAGSSGDWRGGPGPDGEHRGRGRGRGRGGPRGA